MPLTKSPFDATEGVGNNMAEGVNLFVTGPQYTQFAAMTALSNSNSETSLFTGEVAGTNTWSGAIQGARALPVSSRVIPSPALNTYSLWGGEFWGTVQNTSTPTLRMRLFLVNPAGTATAIYDNAALTMTAAASGSYFSLKFRFWTTAFGSSGSVRAICGYEYGSTAAGSAITTVHGAPQATASLDLTQQYYTVDVRATFGAASASNNIQLLGGWFGNIA